jgi:pyruvate/2-oxoglutarate/acetoin dehydrogenase E1 component
MLLDGGNAALFVKQLDFMLLGLDQICNTYNFIRAYSPKESWGSFTIFAIVCDQGYQGPQSSFNGAGDFASIANIPVYCLNGAEDASRIISREFVKPGFRIICLSQKQFNNLQSNVIPQWVSEDNGLFKYKSGDHGTIVSYNFTLNDSLTLIETLNQGGIECDLFQANFVPKMDLEPIIESCSRTGKLVVIDDSKTVTKFSDQILTKLGANDIAVSFLEINRRSFLDDEYGANQDKLDLNVDKFYTFLKN